MKLAHAVRCAERLAAEDGPLRGEDRIAVHVLVQLTKKVLRVQRPLRQLHRALCPEEDLNQESLFDEG